MTINLYKRRGGWYYLEQNDRFFGGFSEIRAVSKLNKAIDKGITLESCLRHMIHRSDIDTSELELVTSRTYGMAPKEEKPTPSIPGLPGGIEIVGIKKLTGQSFVLLLSQEEPKIYISDSRSQTYVIVKPAEGYSFVHDSCGYYKAVSKSKKTFTFTGDDKDINFLRDCAVDLNGKYEVTEA